MSETIFGQERAGMQPSLTRMDSRGQRDFMMQGIGALQKNALRNSQNNLNAVEARNELLRHKFYGNRSCSDLSSKANMIAGLRSRPSVSK